MSTRWYTTREAVKQAVGINGSSLNAVIDHLIEAASEDIERELTGRRFIPQVADTREFVATRSKGQRVGWAESENPWLYGGMSRVLYVGDILEVTTIKIDEDRDGSFADETALASSDFLLIPQNAPNLGEPYKGIQLTENGTMFAWPAGGRVQVVGKWGFSEDTKAGGTVASGLAADATATSMVCSDASKIGVGNTLLIESEQVFVSERALADTTADLNDTLTAGMSDVTVTVSDGTKIKAGEVIQIDSEKMLVESIASNNLTVQRAVDGSVLAAHSTGVSVYAFRTLTIVRAVNGTTGATHADATAIEVYTPPADIVEFATAQAIANHEQGKSGWTGAIGGDESGVVETRMFNIFAMRNRIREKYKLVSV